MEKISEIDKPYLWQTLKQWNVLFNSHVVPVICTNHFRITEKIFSVEFLLFKYNQCTLHENTSDVFSFEITLNLLDYPTTEAIVRRIDEIMQLNFTKILSGFCDEMM